MSIVATLIAAFAVVLGCLALLAPRRALAFYRSWLNPRGLALAAALRMTFGVSVLMVAPDTPAGWVLRVLAVLSLVGAVLGPALGVERARRIVEWEARQKPAAIRVAGALVVALGTWMTWALVSIVVARLAGAAILGLIAFYAFSG